MTRHKILIVDDDKDFLNLLNVRLKDMGYHVAFASDVPSAIMMTRKQMPDVILLDIGLPGGDGFMVIDRLRAMETLAHIPIIVVTAQHASDAEKRALTAGAQAFLQKPIDIERLTATIQKVLGGSSALMSGRNDQQDMPEPLDKKILVVDDDKDFLQLIGGRLKEVGYRVAFAGDVPSALGVVQKEKPDLILLDIALPGGDGFMLMDRLRAIDRVAHIPIIVITALSQASTKAKALNAGAYAFFMKPVDNRELVSAIRKALGEASNPAQ